MKYIKLKVTKTKDKKDDSVIHYSYEDFDVRDIKSSKMSKDEKYLACEVEDDKGKTKLTKSEYNNY